MSLDGRGKLNPSEIASEQNTSRSSAFDATKLMSNDNTPPLSPSSIARSAQPSPSQGHKDYNRMKYYSSLKTSVLQNQMGNDTTDQDK